MLETLLIRVSYKFSRFFSIHRSTPGPAEKYGSINRRFAGIFLLANSFNRKTMIVCWFSALSSVWSLEIICQCLITQLLNPGFRENSTFVRSRSHKLRAFQIITREAFECRRNCVLCSGSRRISSSNPNLPILSMITYVPTKSLVTRNFQWRLRSIHFSALKDFSSSRFL